MSPVTDRPTGVPGEIIVGGARPAGSDGDGGGPGIEVNAGRPVTTLPVVNRGDRPIQVGSHFHLAEANAALQLDRQAAWGQRLDIPAGTSVRFEAGIERSVDLVPLAGRRRVPGLRGLAGGDLDAVPGTDPVSGGPSGGGPAGGADG
jgi:urease subunit beta